ncbi:MAG: aminopeptidase [bacterium]|nr:aminopeptidase [bacterium]
MENIKNKKVCGWLELDDLEKEKLFSFNDSYLEFLNNVKTEREANKYIIRELTNNGFVNVNNLDKLNVGDKVYYDNRGKSVFAAVIGKNNLEEGINLIGAHIDSPRLDLKPNPLYQDSKLALLKTHYYGGIKKYQWTTIPLAIHGVIVKKNLEKLVINIGEDDNDPIFTITDLLPHLAVKQEDKKLRDAIEGEGLNLLVGSIPKDDSEESIKENILSLLNEKYGLIEADFVSAELEVVPAFKAKSLGFDRSMVASYGQDDRVCAYTSLKAIIDAKPSSYTQVAIFADKEEIGSVGNTGMYSDVFDMFMNELLSKSGEYNFTSLNKLYCNSRMLSADVGAGVDPNYQDVSEKNNASYIGYGVEINKYTGSRGKGGASDANAEFVSFVRSIFEENNVKYQVSELGKVDIGGGGTIAYILANKGIDVIDCGVPVISMHSPYEVTSKYDVYSAYCCYKAFLETEKKVNY